MNAIVRLFLLTSKAFVNPPGYHKSEDEVVLIVCRGLAESLLSRCDLVVARSSGADSDCEGLWSSTPKLLHQETASTGPWAVEFWHSIPWCPARLEVGVGDLISEAVCEGLERSASSSGFPLQ
jgi:hypothetical protein